ncbi:Predicted Fe-Mo cluster-binding protein, NifX family [Tangfeifania diversioriginum]|uniref:Predicted Fe-Mo cluster-binding protein, NifX family n=1 Tax=Tangfeifania diversioriginum TaxID=1168035 RepID=A0A1M6LMY0_9BACT|nr:NifB/NifX family molybdenum-iron cluster-binding protein [Tangfeifania diversioriginum]SHJ72537.1 Predicted Fe-Mo cluster-binding protein, NifX family [Tangfeifania diversioriginum]
MKMKCAFALSRDNRFEEKFFGNADNFVIYKLENDELKFEKQMINPYRNVENEGTLNLEEKGQSVIKLLKKQGVSVLVSRQFGENIKMINKHFIPVIIKQEKPEEVVAVLQKHHKWLWDELTNKSSGYMLFQIKEGVLKTQINPGV